MEPQTECENTTDNNIQNTSRDPNDQQGSETPISKKPMKSEQSTDHGEGKSSQYFTLLDLHRLTFTLDDVEVLDAQHATNEQFSALVNAVADVSNVEQWYLEERRDFVNQLYAWCEERNYPFPFTLVDEEKTATQPLEEGTNDALTD